VEFGSSTATKMSIDRRTAMHLELIGNVRTGSQKESLFGTIDHTKTVVGARLLRSNILRPSTGDPQAVEVLRLFVLIPFITFDRHPHNQHAVGCGGAVHAVRAEL
jgi:hypothetical protein